MYLAAKTIVSNVVKSDLDLVCKFLAEGKEFSSLERVPTSPSCCNRSKKWSLKEKKTCMQNTGLKD